MQATYLGFTHERFAVGHREADIQIVPVLRLTDGADRREIPFQVVSEFRLGNHFIAIEMAADVIPLATTVDDLPTGMEFQRAAYPRRVAHLVDQRLAEDQWLVVQRVRRLRAVGGKETVEITFARKVFVQRLCFRVLWLGQFQTACLPVAPAVGGGQILRQTAGQLVGVVPAGQTQQQAQAPFRDGVVAQFRVVLGHHVQRAAVETTGKGQADFPGNRDFFIAGEMHAAGVTVEQRHGLVRILTGQSAQAEADHIGHRFIGRGKARRLIEQFGFLRDIDQQTTARGEGGQAVDQTVGQWIVAGLSGKFGALPAFLFSELAIGCPDAEQRVTRGGLGFASQPELFSIGVPLGLMVAADLVLRIQAVQFSEVEFRVVILDEGGPVATVGEPAQPAQFHPVGLGQVTVFGEELFDFRVARGFQPRGQFVVGQVRFQRVIGQRLAVAKVRAGITLGQGALGFIVILALGGQVHRLGGLNGSGRQ
ncbi:hypothetical protein D3C87_1011130 [compost metagenome]